MILFSPDQTRLLWANPISKVVSQFPGLRRRGRASEQTGPRPDQWVWSSLSRSGSWRPGSAWRERRGRFRGRTRWGCRRCWRIRRWRVFDTTAAEQSLRLGAAQPRTCDGWIEVGGLAAYQIKSKLRLWWNKKGPIIPSYLTEVKQQITLKN